MPRIAQSSLPPDGVFSFTAQRTRRFVLPAAIHRGLTHLGWDATWLGVKWASKQFIAHGRGGTPPTIGVPTWLEENLKLTKAKERVDIQVWRPHRCQEHMPCPGVVDLARYVPEDAFPVGSDDKQFLWIHVRNASPLKLYRDVSIEVLHDIVKLGPKLPSKTWQTASTHPRKVAEVVQLLSHVIADPSRIKTTTSNGSDNRKDLVSVRVEGGRTLSSILQLFGEDPVLRLVT